MIFGKTCDAEIFDKFSVYKINFDDSDPVLSERAGKELQQQQSHFVQ